MSRRGVGLVLVAAGVVVSGVARADTPSSVPTPPSQPAVAPAQQPPPRLREVTEEREAREERESDSRERAERREEWQNEKIQVPFSAGLGILQSKRFPGDSEAAAPAMSLAVGVVVPLTIDVSLQGRLGLFVTTPMEYDTSYGNTQSTESHVSWGFAVDTTIRYKHRAFVAGLGPTVGKFSAHRRGASSYGYGYSGYQPSSEAESYVFGGAVLELGARWGDHREFELLARPSIGSGGERLWGAQFVTFGWAPF